MLVVTLAWIGGTAGVCVLWTVYEESQAERWPGGQIVYREWNVMSAERFAARIVYGCVELACCTTGIYVPVMITLFLAERAFT